MKIWISIFFVLTLIILTSQIKINIECLDKDKNSFKIHFKANIGIFLFGLVKIIGINFTETEMQILFIKIPYSKITFNKESLKVVKQISILDTLKILNQKIEKLIFNLEIGSENVMFTVFLVSITSILFSIFSFLNYSRINLKKFYYNIHPIYNTNVLSFNFSTIITFKIINIIKAFMYIKKNKKQNNKFITKISVNI